ncbi:hypothetical protein HPB50_015688 [Hyalomma asiaticum]|uniref:Uncharacterized protein n=1 Tax=Hyalomma asiaticum TaxID=266040 RepID=A0ACB7SVQ2_HYAAI|nr:hypothetical protein HPB50_015688 [Hyalomma asiaticum]
MNLNADLRLIMDKDADPCQDFYHFVCANFKSAYPSSASYMDVFTKHVKRSFRKMMNDFVIDKPAAIQHYPLQSYRKCIDEYKGMVQQPGVQTIIDNDNELAELWGSIKSRRPMERKMTFLLRLSMERGTPVFIGTDVVRNTYTRQRNKLRLKIEKVKPPPDRRTVQDIVEYFSRVSSWVSGLRVSRAIVATMKGAVDVLRDPSIHVKVPQLFDILAVDIISNVSLYYLLNVVDEYPADPVDWWFNVFSTDGMAILALSKYLSTVELTAFSYTVRFIIAEALLTTASYGFVQLYDMPPAVASRNRMLRCADLSLTLLPTLTEYHFFQEWLGQGSSAAPPNFFASMPDKFSLVEPFAGMLEETKVMLNGTLHNITVVGGRDLGYNTITDIRDKMTGVKGIGTDFTRWVLDALKSKAAFRLELISTQKKLPANAYSLDLNPGVVYDASVDVLRVLPSLLLPPFDVTANASSFNFGHVGTYVAEAFGLATLPQSLSEIPSRMEYPAQDDRNRFLKELDCFREEQASADNTVLGVKESLGLLNSAIGLKVALKAWEDWKDRGTAKFVPYVRTDEQAFFVGFCLRHCGAVKSSVDSDVMNVNANSSLTRSQLCNLPLRHVPEFANAFFCAANSSMFSSTPRRLSLRCPSAASTSVLIAPQGQLGPALAWPGAVQSEAEVGPEVDRGDTPGQEELRPGSRFERRGRSLDEPAARIFHSLSPPSSPFRAAACSESQE